MREKTNLELLADKYFMLKNMQVEGFLVEGLLKETWEEYVKESHFEMDKRLFDQKHRIEDMFHEKGKR